MFNRAALFNVGFKEVYKVYGNFDCVVFQVCGLHILHLIPCVRA